MNDKREKKPSNFKRRLKRTIKDFLVSILLGGALAYINYLMYGDAKGYIFWFMVMMPASVLLFDIIVDTEKLKEFYKFNKK